MTETDIPLLPPKYDEYVRQLLREMNVIIDEPDRGGEVKPVTEKVSGIWRVGITHVVTPHSGQ